MDYKLIDFEKRTTRALDAVSISFYVNRVTLKKCLSQMLGRS